MNKINYLIISRTLEAITTSCPRGSWQNSFYRTCYWRFQQNHDQVLLQSAAAATDWDSLSKLDQYCISKVEFWKDNTIQGNVRYCFSGSTSNCFVYSDTSGTGCGAHMTLNQEYMCHTMWSETERMKSSTRREFCAIEFAPKSFCAELKDSHVKWFTCNLATSKIVEVGSMRKDLHYFALRIFQICLEYEISLDIQWVPRNVVAHADFISRFIDFDDWHADYALFLFSAQRIKGSTSGGLLCKSQ